MNIVGLITEYNPFHNGHQYHIEEAKRLTGADTVLVVMSGNFVQRGTPAIIDKYHRTQMALECGADLVIELPTCYATASAETFALGAVSLLNQLGIVDSIVFGSECGNIDLLKKLARIIVTEPPEYQDILKASLKTGLSYPQSRTVALLEHLTNTKDPVLSCITHKELKQVLSSPNNILGIEYLKALIRLDSTIKAYTVQRIQSNYHSEALEGTISSATSIRSSMEAAVNSDHNTEPASFISLESVAASMPPTALKILKDEYGVSTPITAESMNLAIRSELLNETCSSLNQYSDITSDLANRMIQLSNVPSSYESFVLDLKSRQYTQTRIQRCLLHMLLKITKDDMEQYTNQELTPYARILGFRKSSTACLRSISEDSKITLITKLANAPQDIQQSAMFTLDLKASRLYSQLVYETFGTVLTDEYKQNLIIRP